jgi:hypothetical protein
MPDAAAEAPGGAGVPAPFVTSERRDLLPTGGTILRAVGYNPYRRFRARRADYVLVAVALMAALALVIWAVIG